MCILKCEKMRKKAIYLNAPAANKLHEIRWKKYRWSERDESERATVATEEKGMEGEKGTERDTHITYTFLSSG